MTELRETLRPGRAMAAPWHRRRTRAGTRGESAALDGGLAALSLAALGIVYGDIGTSPLYAFQVALAPAGHVAITRANVLGVLSLFFWALIVVVTVKYVLFVMRASNDGEGGVMALMALLLQRTPTRAGRGVVVLLGLVGVALFYGDGVITPAISVLSSVEGTSVVTPAFHRFEVPATLGILTALFLIQSRGTARIGRLFGPIMIVWFAAIALLGLRGIAENPSVVAALNPLWGVDFFLREPTIAFVALGAVVLCITGTEALYADMGHFGRRPIAAAWTLIVLPALALSYYGQGALVLAQPRTADNPFFRLAPQSLTLALVVLATVATIIASQAVISGAYSLTQQAIQLGFLPRMRIRHTSSTIRGQIYVPKVNWTLYAAILLLVLAFRSSGALASAYGIAVTGTMVTTTLLAYMVARRVWRWSRRRAVLVSAPLLAVDLVFFSANALKIIHGGWFPLAFGLAVLSLMTTWRRGRELAAERMRDDEVTLRRLINRLVDEPPLRVPGTAVFLTASTDAAPRALIRNIQQSHVLHERPVLLTIETAAIPHVSKGARVRVDRLRLGFVRVVACYGFRDQPDARAALALADEQAELGLDLDGATYFLNRVTFVPQPRLRGMAAWRKRLFVALGANATTAARHLGIPSDALIELGTHVDL